MKLQIIDNPLTLQVKQVKTIDKTYNNAQACEIILHGWQTLSGFFFWPYELFEIIDTQSENITARPINAHTNQNGKRDTYTNKVKMMTAGLESEE